LANVRILVVLVVLLLGGLPLAVWLDLRAVTQHALLVQANDFDSVITGIRTFYADEIVRNVIDAPAGTPGSVRHDFELHPGAIPIPATFSLELGRVVADRQGTIQYRFISHYPFKGRAPHEFNAFEEAALKALEADPRQPISGVSWHGTNSEVRYVTPIIMGRSCVACHNSDPESPKRDWKVGDVRGIQELIVTQPIAPNVFSFKFLLIYFVFAGALGLGFILLQRRQAAFMASISTQLSRYLSPQIYRSIFSGKTGAEIHTARKKLTIFFSDIKDFTQSSERLQPEELTKVLNEYFTEMSAIALAHGGTIDKFVGDAILVFYGDPESRGEAEDARACLRMAIEMQAKVAELGVKWRNEGIEEPFRVRMGINTGYCNVGNFGSKDRMDYTIIGAEANLAARLQSIAEPGRVVVSYETYALVRDIAAARRLEPIHVKGVSREVRPFEIEGLRDAAGVPGRVVSEHAAGLDLYLDVAMIDAAGAQRARRVLQEALDALSHGEA
jgi:class 3 adenylate cyclase